MDPVCETSVVRTQNTKTHLLSSVIENRQQGTWYSVTRHLSSTQHCICLDLPGHGESTWKEDDDLNTAGFVKRIHEFVRATKMHKITGQQKPLKASVVRIFTDVPEIQDVVGKLLKANKAQILGVRWMILSPFT